jgi:hypothetical protein
MRDGKKGRKEIGANWAAGGTSRLVCDMNRGGAPSLTA